MSNTKEKLANAQADVKAKQLAEEEAKRTFFYQAGNKILDGKGNVVLGYTTNGTQVFNNRGEFLGYLTTVVKSRGVSQEIKEQMAAQLPQTGEKTEQNLGKLAALMIRIASVLGLVDIDRRKKKEF